MFFYSLSYFLIGDFPKYEICRSGYLENLIASLDKELARRFPWVGSQLTTLILAVKTIHPPSSTVQLFLNVQLCQDTQSILSQLFTLAYMENRTYFQTTLICSISAAEKAVSHSTAVHTKMT